MHTYNHTHTPIHARTVTVDNSQKGQNGSRLNDVKWEEETADDIPDIFNDPLRVFNAFHIIRVCASKNLYKANTIFQRNELVYVLFFIMLLSKRRNYFTRYIT